MGVSLCSYLNGTIYNPYMLKKILAAVLVVAIYSAFVCYQRYNFVKHAIYTIAVPYDWRATEGASDCYINVLYRDSVYKVNATGLNCAAGKRYIVAMLPGDPLSARIVRLAPHCLDTLDVPYSGWKVVPQCDSPQVDYSLPW